LEAVLQARWLFVSLPLQRHGFDPSHICDGESGNGRILRYIYLPPTHNKLSDWQSRKL